MNINDLSILLAAVDIALKRGAFSILEVGAIGDVATKLNEFLKAANEQAAAAQAAQAEGSAPAEGGDAATEAPAEAPAENQ